MCIRDSNNTYEISINIENLVNLKEINSGAEFSGFSKTFPSVEVWNKLSSTEKGGAPFLSFGIGILCFFA